MFDLRPESLKTYEMCLHIVVDLNCVGITSAGVLYK